MKTKKRIPPERLAFVSGSLRKNDSYADDVTVHGAPFDLDTIKDKTGEDRWETLKNIGIAYLKEKGVLPDSAKNDEYKRSSWWGLLEWKELKSISKKYENGESKS
jgi:hypothetical protein